MVENTRLKVLNLRKLACALVLLLLASQTTVYAEPGSELLKRYDIPYADPAVEGQKLEKMEQAYQAAAHKVNTNTMLSAAMDLYDDYSSLRLKEIDKDIYALSDKLQAIEEEMSRSKSAEVAAIIQLDTDYRAVNYELEEKRAQRAQWMEQANPISPVSAEELSKDKKELASLGIQVNRQKEAVELANSCPDVGKVSAFQFPLNGTVHINSPFGIRLDPVTRESMSMHKGVDLQAAEGTNVLAAFNGYVAEAATNEQIGNYVVLTHGCGIQTLYGHLSGFSVSKGQQVNQYQPIAKSGNTGTESTGPHLHFGLFINGTAVDPAKLLPNAR